MSVKPVGDVFITAPIVTESVPGAPSPANTPSSGVNLTVINIGEESEPLILPAL